MYQHIRGSPTDPWRSLAWWVLPTLTLRAATRPNNAAHCLLVLGHPVRLPGQVIAGQRATDWSSPVRSPCSQMHARPAGHVAMTAGGLLPHRFSPHPQPFSILRVAGGFALCCGCSQRRLSPPLPPLAVSWGTLALPYGQGQESGSSSGKQHPLPSSGPPALSMSHDVLYSKSTQSSSTMNCRYAVLQYRPELAVHSWRTGPGMV